MTQPSSRFQWQLDWKSLLAIVLMLPVLLSLGSWQLQRADEKEALLLDFQQRQALPPVAITDLDEYLNYRPVTAKGQFDSARYWLLDNRIVDGRFGYEVVGLFSLKNGRKLLVNRGWIQGDPGRQQLPLPPVPAAEIELQGQLYLGKEKPFSLGEQVVTEWPRLQQWLNPEALHAEFPALLPTVLQLNQQSPAALKIKRIVVNVSPEKHIGYAVQWFGMALVLAIIFLCRNSNIVPLLRRSSTLRK